MNSGKECLAGERCITRYPEQRPAMFGNPQFIGIPVKLPEPDVCRSGRKRHPLLALLEQVLGALSPAPLNQQGAQKYRLQAEDEKCRKNGAAMLIPDRRLFEQNNGVGREVFLL